MRPITTVSRPLTYADTTGLECACRPLLPAEVGRASRARGPPFVLHAIIHVTVESRDTGAGPSAESLWCAQSTDTTFQEATNDLVLIRSRRTFDDAGAAHRPRPNSWRN